jgi:uncharacterized protein YutE (UPF0331/DUF86 family)
MNSRIKDLTVFLDETLDYFTDKIKDVTRDSYFADRDIRNILDKTINDIILCIVDLSEEMLKEQRKQIPDTYRDTILSCHEFIGDIVLKVAETIHQYLKVNWQNIVTVKNRLPDIREFGEAVRHFTD